MASWASAQAAAADEPVPYTLTGQAEAALDAEPEPEPDPEAEAEWADDWRLRRARTRTLDRAEPPDRRPSCDAAPARS